MRKYYGDGRARPRCPWATAGTGCETRARPRYRWAAAGDQAVPQAAQEPLNGIAKGAGISRPLARAPSLIHEGHLDAAH